MKLIITGEVKDVCAKTQKFDVTIEVDPKTATDETIIEKTIESLRLKGIQVDTMILEKIQPFPEMEKLLN